MISIIIIAKNEEEYLPRLLKSIKEQDYKDYELILSDADSTDRTKEIGEEYNCKIIKGGLPSIGRNNGAKIAKGNLLLFLDSDVEMPKDFLSKVIKEFEKRKLGVGTPYHKPITNKKIDKALYDAYNKWTIATQHFYPHGAGCAVFCKKEVFDKVKGFDEKLLFAEDHDFVKRCKKKSKFRILRSSSILVDVRRLDKEGRFNLVKKYVKGALHRTFKGEMYNPPFEYELQGGVKVKEESKKNNGK